MHRRHLLILMTLIALLAAACGGESSGEETTSTTEAEAAQPTATEAQPEPTTTVMAEATTTAAPATEEPEGVIPELNVGAALQPYGTEDITQGQVVVYWYRGAGGGNYIALYTGEGIASASGLKLCPGNSIATDTWYHITNAPAEDGACEWGPQDVGSLQVCDHGVWIYETAIPGDMEGDLYGSLEWTSLATGEPTGLTSVTKTSADMPEFEAGLASYSLPPWFTPDGASVINCN